MNKYPIVALILLLAGIALVVNSSGISCPFAGENSSCRVNGNCTGNCSANGSGNYSENCTCPRDAACAQNNTSEENCSALGSCPV
ncbi:MAG: hypothetical protein JW999_09815 [Methanotrichaceae archaeon]|nr:hypothetical protein [Methanotrichaceae archaeon]